MFLKRKNKNFYTESQKGEGWIDHISIDEKRKRYILDIDKDERTLGGYERGKPVYSYYVSRLIFDIIVTGIKEQGFSEYKGR